MKQYCYYYPTVPQRPPQDILPSFVTFSWAIYHHTFVGVMFLLYICLILTKLQCFSHTTLSLHPCQERLEPFLSRTSEPGCKQRASAASQSPRWRRGAQGGGTTPMTPAVRRVHCWMLSCLWSKSCPLSHPSAAWLKGLQWLDIRPPHVHAGVVSAPKSLRNETNLTCKWEELGDFPNINPKTKRMQKSTPNPGGGTGNVAV